MIQTTADAIIAAVPIGADHAIRQREIWKRAGMLGAESSAGIYLFEALASGTVKRRKHPIPTGFVWLYWRDAE